MREINFDDLERPKYGDKELMDHELQIIYALSRDEYFGQLNDFEKRGICGKLFFKDTADLPDVANTFMDLNHPVTQKVAQVAKEESDDLMRSITAMYHDFLALALPAETPFTIPKNPFDPKKQYTTDEPMSIRSSANIRGMIEFYWRHHTVDDASATAQYQAWITGKDPLPNPQQGPSSSGSKGKRRYDEMIG